MRALLGTDMIAFFLLERGEEQEATSQHKANTEDASFALPSPLQPDPHTRRRRTRIGIMLPTSPPMHGTPAGWKRRRRKRSCMMGHLVMRIHPREGRVTSSLPSSFDSGNSHEEEGADKWALIQIFALFIPCGNANEVERKCEVLFFFFFSLFFFRNRSFA